MKGSSFRIACYRGGAGTGAGGEPRRRAFASAEAASSPAPTNVFAPDSTHAWIIYKYSLLVFAITGAIFVVVGGLLLYAIVRFRQRKGDDKTEPPQVYGSEQVEIAWTVIPVIVVIVLVLTTARTIHEIQDAPRPPGALEVTAIGQQWWWEFRYPSLGIVTANELHIPVSDRANPTPTFLRLLSADVAHSFWVPRLAGKTDLIPNRVNQMWIDPAQPGLYLGQCAEYCGTQHAKMLLRVYVHTRDDFAALGGRAEGAGRRSPPTAATAAGAVFETTACLNCHAVAGTVAERPLRPRPHPPHEPRHPGRRRREEHRREPEALDQGPRRPQAGIPDAAHAPAPNRSWTRS